MPDNTNTNYLARRGHPHRPGAARGRRRARLAGRRPVGRRRRLAKAGRRRAPAPVWVMYPFRVVLGFAVGAASATVPVYLAETAPKRIRGSIVAIDQLMIVTGQLLAFAMNAAISTTQKNPKITIL